MRSTWLLFHVAALASLCDAFHPFIPAWMDEEPNSRNLGQKHASRTERGVRMPLVQRTGQITGSSAARAKREAARLTRKHVRDAAQNHSGLRRRKNEYHIMEAESDGKYATEGIAQDGTDFSYFVKAKLGSKEKEVYMLVDSASGTSWVMGPDCSSEACFRHDTFGAQDSDTFKTDKKDFKVSYGTGEITGILAHDTIGVAGVNVELELGIVNNASEHFLHYAFDGILGLSLGKGQTQNFLDTMSEDGELRNNIFSVALSRASDGVNEGEIAFGTINKDKFTGDITYVDVIPKSDAWTVKLGAMSYQGKKSGVGGVSAYIDTGSTFMYGPADLVKQMHSVIPGAESRDKDGLSYKVPCDSNALTFSFGGANFEISPKDWISPPNDKDECTSNLYGHDVAAGSLLLGATFVKNVYCVFDKDKKRIGFAPLVQPEPRDTTTAKSSDATPTPTKSSATLSTSATSSGITAFSDKDTSSMVSKPSLGLTGPEKPASTDTSSDKTDDDKKNSEKDENGGDEDSAASMCLGHSNTIWGVVLTALLLLSA